MEAKRKPLPNTKDEKPALHLLPNIPRMALKGTTDSKTTNQHRKKISSISKGTGDMKVEYA